MRQAVLILLLGCAAHLALASQVAVSSQAIGHTFDFSTENAQSFTWPIGAPCDGASFKMDSPQASTVYTIALRADLAGPDLASGSCTGLAVNDTCEVTWNPVGLTSGTVYYLKFNCTNGGGCVADTVHASTTAAAYIGGQAWRGGSAEPNDFTFTVTTPVGRPSAPQSVAAVAGNAQASISFQPPASNGGSVITQYRVISSPGNIQLNGTSSPIVLTGLNNGQAYTFAVSAYNQYGEGPSASTNMPVTPTAPNRPQCQVEVGQRAICRAQVSVPETACNNLIQWQNGLTTDIATSVGIPRARLSVSIYPLSASSCVARVDIRGDEGVGESPVVAFENLQNALENPSSPLRNGTTFGGQLTATGLTVNAIILVQCADGSYAESGNCSDDSIILGLKLWQLLVIIGGIVLLIACVMGVSCFCKKRDDRKYESRLARANKQKDTEISSLETSLGLGPKETGKEAGFGGV